MLCRKMRTLCSAKKECRLFDKNRIRERNDLTERNINDILILVTITDYLKRGMHDKTQQTERCDFGLFT